MDTGVFSKTDVDGKPYKPGEYLDYTPKNEPDVLLNEITGAKATRKVTVKDLRAFENKDIPKFSTHGFQMQEDNLGPLARKLFQAPDLSLKNSQEYITAVENTIKNAVEKNLNVKVKLASVYDIARRISEGYTTHGNLETPFYYVHCDYTPSSGDKRLQQRASSNLDLNAPVSFKPIQERFDDPGELDRYINGNGRFIIVDLWKNADPNGSTVQQSALAMCDPNSVPDDNYVTTEIRCSDGSSYWDFRVSGGEDDTDCADHKWYYYSNMTVDECWMFVNHDSGRQLKSVPHSAFQIPHGPNITRRSIETRAFVFLE